MAIRVNDVLYYYTGRYRDIGVTLTAAVQGAFVFRIPHNGSSTFAKEWTKERSAINAPLLSLTVGYTVDAYDSATQLYAIRTKAILNGVGAAFSAPFTIGRDADFVAAASVSGTGTVRLREVMAWFEATKSLYFYETPDPEINSIDLTITNDAGGGAATLTVPLLTVGALYQHAQRDIGQWVGQSFGDTRWLAPPPLSGTSSPFYAGWLAAKTAYEAGCSTSDVIASYQTVFTGPGTRNITAGQEASAVVDLSYSGASARQTVRRLTLFGFSDTTSRSAQTGEAKFRPIADFTATAELWRIDRPETDGGALAPAPVGVAFNGGPAVAYHDTALSGSQQYAEAYSYGGARLSASLTQLGAASNPVDAGSYETAYDPSARQIGYAQIAGGRASLGGSLAPGVCAVALPPGLDDVTLSQAAQTDYVGGSGLPFAFNAAAEMRWTATPNTSLSLGTGNVLRIMAGATSYAQVRAVGILSVDANGNPGYRYVGYRYLRIRYRSVGSAGQSFGMGFLGQYNTFFSGTIYPREATLTTGADGIWTETDIDLLSCAWPPVTVGGAERENVVSGWARINSFALLDLTPGVTYEVEVIRGVRKYGNYLQRRETLGNGNILNEMRLFSDGLLALRRVQPLLNANPPVYEVGSYISEVADYLSAGKPWSGVTASYTPQDSANAGLVIQPFEEMGRGRAPFSFTRGDGLPSAVLSLRVAYAYAQIVQFYDGFGTLGADWAGRSYGADIAATFRLYTGMAVYGIGGPMQLRDAAGSVIQPYPALDASGFYVTNPPILVDARAFLDTAVVAAAQFFRPAGAGKYGRWLNPYSIFDDTGMRIPLTVNSTITGDPLPVRARIADGQETGVDPGEVILARLGAREYIRWCAAGIVAGAGEPLTVDSARGWLFVGDGKKIKSYHIVSGQPAFASADHPVQGWRSLCYDARRVTLYALADVAAGQVKLYASPDGGQSIGGGILTMTADTAALAADSARGVLILLLAVSGGNIQYRLSRDGGATWDGVSDIRDASGLSVAGEVLDAVYDERPGGLLVASFRVSGNVVVWQSHNWGADWTQLLT